MRSEDHTATVSAALGSATLGAPVALFAPVPAAPAVPAPAALAAPAAPSPAAPTAPAAPKLADLTLTLSAIEALAETVYTKSARVKALKSEAKNLRYLIAQDVTELCAELRGRLIGNALSKLHAMSPSKSPPERM